MITKETAREIYNCYQQMEAIEKTKSEILEEVERLKEKAKEKGEPIPRVNDYGRFGRGMQLGIPDGYSSSMRIYDISPELGISVMDEHLKNLQKKMKDLEAEVEYEMNHPATKAALTDSSEAQEGFEKEGKALNVMNRFRFSVYGYVWADEDIDDKAVKEKIAKNMEAFSRGRQMSVDEVIVEEDEE